VNAKVYRFESPIKSERGLSNSSVVPDAPHNFESNASLDSNDSTEQFNVTSLEESHSDYNEEINETTWNIEEMNETTWDNEELYRVRYRCDSDLLIGGDDRRKYYRECVNGSWNGEAPECGESRA
jgi:hypothetical protein